MKKIILNYTFLILSFNMQAQMYHIGIGARFGKFNNGVTFKEFFNADQHIGIEAQVYSSLIAATYGYTFKGFLFKQIPFHIPLLELPLDFIIGGGVQVGYFPFDKPGFYKIVDGKPDYYNKTVVNAGIAANIGIEYKLGRVAPFTVGIDAVPFYEFINHGPEWFDFGLDVRYVIR